MKLTYDRSALSEIEDAAAWYEEERHELAREFVAELNSSIKRLLEYPKAWPQVGKRSGAFNSIGFLTESSIKFAKTKFSSLRLRTCIESPNIGATA